MTQPALAPPLRSTVFLTTQDLRSRWRRAHNTNFVPSLRTLIAHEARRTPFYLLHSDDRVRFAQPSEAYAQGYEARFVPPAEQSAVWTAAQRASRS